MVKTTPGKPLTPVQKLLHLADVEGLRVQFTDYPKVSTFFLNISDDMFLHLSLTFLVIALPPPHFMWRIGGIVRSVPSCH